MKNISIILLIVIACMIALIMCGRGNREPSELQRKFDNSLLIDSLKRIETSKINSVYDSLISEKKKEDSLHKVKIETLSQKYYALRKIVKKYEGVIVDSIPKEAVTASINSGSMCDSLLMYQDQELAIKDSIISYREIQLQAERKQNATTTQALSDLIALNEQEKEQKFKSAKLNKKLPLIATLSAFSGSLLTIILLK